MDKPSMWQKIVGVALKADKLVTDVDKGVRNAGEVVALTNRVSIRGARVMVELRDTAVDAINTIRRMRDEPPTGRR